MVYTGTKRTFIDDVYEDRIADIVEERVFEHLHRRTGRAEYRSWENSMQYMERALSSSSIPDGCGIAIEYNIPLTAKRVDFMVSGYDSAGKSHVKIVELKQWEDARAVPGFDGVVETYVGGGQRRVTHPSYQAWSYATAIANFNATVEDRSISLHPCAYAHNYKKSNGCDLLQPQYADYLALAPLFGRHENSQIASFLAESIDEGDDGRVLEDIDHGSIRPSKRLQDALVSMLNGNPEFTLLDSQKVVYETALSLAHKSHDDHKKRVYIVKGGPGTGKSVLAINLLAQLVGHDGQVAQYVSKNSAPRVVYKTKLKGSRKAKDIDLLFKGSGSFVGAEYDSSSTLLVDEAHRLNEKSGLYGNLGENQIKELISASVCTVFFIDEHQRVQVNDIGSVEEIERWAERLHAEVSHGELDSQFRCNGSDGYLAWVDNALDIEETANVDLDDTSYDFRVFGSPEELQAAIVGRNEKGGKARLVAGYCWDWPKASRRDPSAHDITIGDWGISWNLEGGEAFAIDPTSIDEAGCIHTVQGLEFDYVGVIIGPDMGFDGERVTTDFHMRSRSDQSIRGLKKMERENPDHARKLGDEIVRNTYRVLMTRGMKGCYVYCTDEGLAAHLRELATSRQNEAEVESN